MKKITKDQKHYRTKKQKNETDFQKETQESDRKGARVTRRKIDVSINQATFDRLIELSGIENISRWKMLSRIIITKLPMYTKLTNGSPPTKRYDWDEKLLAPTDKKINSKGIEEKRQVTYQITSTALKKLESNKNATSQSIARIIQLLILNYKPATKEQREKQNAYIKASRKSYQKTTKEIALADSVSSFKRRKFFQQEDLILHVKGLPPEKWDDDELYEFERMQQGLND